MVGTPGHMRSFRQDSGADSEAHDVPDSLWHQLFRGSGIYFCPLSRASQQYQLKFEFQERQIEGYGRQIAIPNLDP